MDDRAHDGTAAAAALRSSLGGLALGLGRPGMVAGAAAIDASSLASLHPIEASAVVHASEGRRAEFASGRAVLRDLVERLSGERSAIPVSPDRRPLLPAGIAASLAHDRDVVVAVAEHDPGRLSLGVDVEPDGSVGDDLRSIVCRPDERTFDPTLVFCAKEAAYKAWSMAGGRFLEHHDVRIGESGPHLVAEVLPDGTRIAVATATVAGRRIALAVLVRS